MIEIGIRIIIEGVPYRVIHATPGQIGKYVLIVEVDNTLSTDIRLSIASLLEQLQDSKDRFEISKLVINWFVDEKLKSGININQMMSIKAKPTAAEQQIRRLMKEGEDVQTIIEVLAFCIFDKFWSGVLNTSINTIATPKQDGVTLYSKIKAKMIMERQKDITEIHQQTAEETEGIMFVE